MGLDNSKHGGAAYKHDDDNSKHGGNVVKVTTASAYRRPWRVEPGLGLGLKQGRGRGRARRGPWREKD